MRVVSPFDLAVEPRSPTPFPPSVPGFAKTPTTQADPDSAVQPPAAFLPSKGKQHRHAHTLTPTHVRVHTRTLTAPERRTGPVWRLRIGTSHLQRAPPHPRRCLPPAWDPDGAAFGLRAPTGSPEAPFPFSRGPALGSLPPRAHGLSTPTLPHPAVPISHAPPGPAAGGGFAGEGVSFCTLPGLQRGLTLKPLSVPTTLPPAQRRNP